MVKVRAGLSVLGRETEEPFNCELNVQAVLV